MHSGGLELALVLMLAAIVAVPVFKRFGLGAVLAYLVAGVGAWPGRRGRGAGCRTHQPVRPRSVW